MPLEALLFAFGPVTWLDSDGVRHRITGQELFHKLSSAGIWFACIRNQKRAIPILGDTPALFYLKQFGVIASAIVSDSRSLDATDDKVLAECGLQKIRFQARFEIKNVTLFEQPVNLSNLVDELQFVVNKQHWGTALRTTPREIALSDYETIAKSGMLKTQTGAD